MSFDLAVGVGRHCTLYSRVEYRSCFPVGAPGKTRARRSSDRLSREIWRAIPRNWRASAIFFGIAVSGTTFSARSRYNCYTHYSAP